MFWKCLYSEHYRGTPIEFKSHERIHQVFYQKHHHILVFISTWLKSLRKELLQQYSVLEEKDQGYKGFVKLKPFL